VFMTRPGIETADPRRALGGGGLQADCSQALMRQEPKLLEALDTVRMCQ